MNTVRKTSVAKPSHQDKQIALKVVLNILDKWHCKDKEMITLLGLGSKPTLSKYKKDPMSAKVSNDLLERLSYILNIHKCLRIIFTREDSVYEWVRKPNGNPLFGGESAMDVMLRGKVTDLYNVSRLLHSYRGGQS